MALCCALSRPDLAPQYFYWRLLAKSASIACNGDSGGPVYIYMYENGQKVPYVLGVTSAIGVEPTPAVDDSRKDLPTQQAQCEGQNKVDVTAISYFIDHFPSLREALGLQ